MAFEQLNRTNPDQLSREQIGEQSEKKIPVACPNCGKQTEVSAKVTTTPCQFCQSALRPTSESLEAYHAAHSKLPNAILASDLRKGRVGWLADLLDSNELEMIKDLSPYQLRSKFGAFAANYHTALPLAERIQDRIATEKILDEKVPKLEELTNVLLAIPDRMWSVRVKKDSYDATYQAYVPVIHDSGKMSVLMMEYYLDVDNQMYAFRNGKVDTNLTAQEYRDQLAAKDEHWHVKITLKRFSQTPDTEEDLEKALADFNYFVDKSKSLQEAAAEISFWDLDSYATPTAEKQIYNNPAESRFIEKANDFDERIKAQIRALLKKARGVVSQNSDNPVLLKSEKDPTKSLQVEEIKTVEMNALAIACPNCGRQVEGFEGTKAYSQCQACNTYVDAVKAGKVNIQNIESEKLSDTVLPADFFLQLVVEAEEPNRQYTSAISDILSNPDLDANGEGTYYRSLLFIDAITKVAENNPHLLSHFSYNFEGKYGPEYGNGAVLFVRFPKKSTISSYTNRGQLDMNIPSELEGKVICITLGEHDNDLPYTSDEWYRVRGTIFDGDNFDQQFTSMKNWTQRHKDTDTNVETHWLENFDKTAHKELGGDYRERVYHLDEAKRAKVATEGQIYDRIRQIIDTVPPDQEMSEQL